MRVLTSYKLKDIIFSYFGWKLVWHSRGKAIKFYVGVTDHEWFDYLRALPSVDEVNFWQPSASSEFHSLSKGDIFLFKLHRSARTHNQDLIAGGGVFASFSILPISLTWETFEQKNGAGTYSDMRRRLLHYRRIPDVPHEDFKIGCVILTQPFFLDEPLWFTAPEWSASIVRGKGYSIETDAGRFIWNSIQSVWEKKRLVDLQNEAHRIEEERARYGKDTVIHQRLGQGTFRVLVTEAYHRSCAITEEHSLPALEAAHIKPFNENGPHAVNNGLLLRSDFHRLFDRGYITVTPDYRIEVSRRLKEEYENGRSYYPFHGHRLHHFPQNQQDWPSKELFIWHNENIYKT